MDGLLNIGNILSGEEAENIFTSEPEINSEELNIETPEDNSGESKENTPAKEKTTEINSEQIFGDKSESVGSEDDSKDGENTEVIEDSSNNSPNNFYSSIATALKDEGVLSNLQNEDIEKIVDDITFKEAMQKQIQSGLDERLQRIDQALNLGVEPDIINKYENTLQYLGSIDENVLRDEGDQGVEIRKQLIYQDLINRNFSEERALREVEKSFNSGSDIVDAQYALQGNIKYFNESYEAIKEERQAELEEITKNNQNQALQIKKSILEDKEIFQGFDVDTQTRQKIYDSIAQPSHRLDNGQLVTPIQKYEMENREDFIKKLGFLFVYTDGFKSLDKIIKPKLNSKMKSTIKDLESTINNTRRNSNGDISFVTGVKDDPESFILNGYEIDI